ncbi:MAG: tetratricopeptide repeat protein [Synergistaceae bacterium]|nr:tetratricopeptide repeat protein [Synergistaceae bacterium]
MSEDEKKAAQEGHAQEDGSPMREEADGVGEKQRNVPKAEFKIAKMILIAVLLAGGALYYRDSYLPERLFQAAGRSFEEGDYGEAIETYRRALDVKPQQTGIHFRMGYSMEKQGDYRGAMDEYAAHLNDEPDDREALFRLGTLYFDHDMHQDALNALKRAKDLGAPASADYMTGAAAESLGDLKAAREGFMEAIRRSGGDAELLYASSKALMRLGGYPEALSGFTEMGKFVASGDTRAFHGSNAAKAMLGWPTDPACVIEPGVAFGSVTLGETSGDLIADSHWGSPKEQVADGEHSVWGYGGSVEAPETLIFMENDAVIEIVSSAKDFKTPDGLGVANFKEPKYAGRFDRWMAKMGDAVTLYRYVLKEGGLAFFAVGDLDSAVVYSGDMPLSKVDGNEWVKIE